MRKRLAKKCISASNYAQKCWGNTRQEKKLNMTVLYEPTKGGADIVDLIFSKLSVRIKSKPWTINALAFFIDSVRTNAKTRESANSHLATFKFTWEVGKQSVTPNIERRYNNPVRIQTNIYKKVVEILGKEVVARYEKPTLEDQGKRCGMCLEEIIDHKNYKTKKKKMNNKIKTVSYKCKHAVCEKNIAITCQKCHEENA